MTEDGYTLVEMLAALAILGLAMAGLAGAAEAFRNLQLAVARPMASAAALVRAQRDLDRLLAGAGPFLSQGSNGLEGDSSTFSFACGSARCAAALEDAGADAFLRIDFGGSTDTARLVAAAGARFTYADSSAAFSDWRPQQSSQESAKALQSISVVSGSTPLAVTRLWLAEPADCEFDGVTRACRNGAP